VRSTSSSDTAGAGASPLLLYDGACGFCAASVQFILRHERQHALRFAALESEAGRQVRGRHPGIADIDSMIWVEHPGGTEERVLIRSAAGLRIARYMGGVWRMALIAGIIPRPIRDAAYNIIARHRHRLIAGAYQCYVPSPSERQRFLDQPS
jgi:predicted DCC family thiol-disulfide oxidoreductase YuxK